MGVPDYEKLVDLIMATNSDGFNGDTLNGVNKTWWDEGISRGYPLVIEPEYLQANYSFLSYNAMSWGYWGSGPYPPTTPATPYVAMYKAVTRGRHMHHICERWQHQLYVASCKSSLRFATDHNDWLQQAFFNGAGFESWENVW